MGFLEENNYGQLIRTPVLALRRERVKTKKTKQRRVGITSKDISARGRASDRILCRILNQTYILMCVYIYNIN